MKKKILKILALNLSPLQQTICKTKLGHIYMTEGENEKSRVLLNEAIKTAQDEGFQNELAYALNKMGNLEIHLGHFDKAIQVCKEVLELFQKLKKNEEEFEVRTTMALAFYFNGQLDEALNHFQINVDKSHDNNISTLEKARLFNNLGILHEAKGDLDKTISSYEKALELSKEISYSSGICVTLANLLDIYYLVGEMKKAEESYNEGIAIAEKDHNLRNIAYLAGNYANYLINIGNLQLAQKNFEKALLYSQNEFDPKAQVQILYRYSLFWLLKGNTVKAHKILKECLDIILKFHITDTIVDVLTSLSEIHLGNKDFEQAYKHLKEADKNSWMRKSEIDYAKVLIQKARIELVLQRLEDAEMNLIRANWIAESKHNLILQINSLHLLTLIYLLKFKTNSKSVNYDLAIQYNTKAIKIAREKNLIPKLITTLIIRGIIFGIKKDIDKVKEIFDEALSLAERFDIPYLIRTSKDSYAFALGQIDAKRDKSEKSTSNSFFLQMAIDEIKNTTSTFTQKNLKSDDLDNIFLVLFKFDEIEGPCVVLAVNLDPEEKRWHTELLMTGILYSSALGQGQRYHEGLFGLLPFGEDDLRAMIYTSIIKDSTQTSSRSNGSAYFLFTLIFKEEFKHIFMDRQKLEQVFSQEIKSLSNASEITADKLKDIYNHIIQELTKDLF